MLIILSYMDDSWAVMISVALLFALSTAHQIVTMKPGESNCPLQTRSLSF
jgi:hypothetical protein